MAVKNLFDNLSDEQKQLLKNCGSTEELMKLIQEQGIELTDDQLEAISGGEDLWDPVDHYSHRIENS